MQPRVFAILTALLLGVLGLGSVAVTDWWPAAATATPAASAPGAPAAGAQPASAGGAGAGSATPTGDPAVWTRSTLRNKLMAEMDATDPGVALADLDKITKEKPYTVRFCHPIAHELGHAAVKRFNADFQKVISFPHETCAAGYLHGAVEEMLNASTQPEVDLLKLCQPKNSGPCIHGVGHGTMFVAKQDVAKARDLCNKFTTDQNRIRCSEGLFMQLFGPDEEDEQAKANLPADKLAQDPLYPCKDQPSLFQSACYFYAPTFYLSSHDYPNHPEVYADALKWCLNGKAGGGAVDCSRGVGSRTMKYNLDREDWAAQQCATAADGWQRKACAEGLVSYYTVNYTDAGAAGRLCAKITNKEMQGYCRSASGLSASLD
ncbi:hypothetical protein BX285_6074 [Streptomyces sp. 1114.5]|uniref:hypothetical protein n=1 Tax=Streptomyces sp. 1114.5 TaxID=1938830 RepID=UPI000EB0CAE3|nr:hypothetical protein [Streptomyces sp. 1114.5]RKT12108.1 hypothetical protein BX285_6074 [Streptomyces sp. 1114.5]